MSTAVPVKASDIKRGHSERLVSSRFRMKAYVQKMYYPTWGKLDPVEKVHEARAVALEHKTTFTRSVFLQ